MRVLDIGHVAYRNAWQEQERLHAEVFAGGEPAVVLVEHRPVITMGRRGESLGVTNLRASADALETRGVEFVQTDRGGDITFHGPGQLVVYPIIRLVDFRLSVGGYVKLLQDVVIATLQGFGVQAQTDRAGVGVWVHTPTPGPLPDYREKELSKIAAIGVRVKQGVTLHGLALNVTTDLSYYELIVPCGIADRPVTTMRQVLGEQCPQMSAVKNRLVIELTRALDDRRK